MSKKILIAGSEKFIKEMRSHLLSLDVGIDSATAEKEVTRKLRLTAISIVIFEDDAYRAEDEKICSRLLEKFRASRKKFIVLSSNKDLDTAILAKKSGAADYITIPYNSREFFMRLNTVLRNKKRITSIGGGTGLFNLLLALKTLPNMLLTSIVSMSDDGGSSGKLQKLFGILPPGDIRRSLVALSNAPQLMNEVIQHRFSDVEHFGGHNFGNIFLTALYEIKGNMPEAIRALGDLLNIQGIVLPTTTTRTTLCALFDDGTVVKGESKVDLGEGRPLSAHVTKVWHEPESDCYVDAYMSILNSDLVIIGPGDLYTSVITNLLVRGVGESIKNTKAKKVYICNLMTEEAETALYDAGRHISEIIKYLRGDYLDFVIISDTKFSIKAMTQYANKHQFPIDIGDIDHIHKITKAKLVIADVGDETELVRHDADKLRDKIEKIMKKI